MYFSYQLVFYKENFQPKWNKEHKNEAVKLQDKVLFSDSKLVIYQHLHAHKLRKLLLILLHNMLQIMCQFHLRKLIVIFLSLSHFLKFILQNYGLKIIKEMLNRNNTIESVIQIYKLSDALIKTSEYTLILTIKYFDIVFLSRVLKKSIFHMIAQTEMLLFKFFAFFIGKVDQKLVIIHKLIVVVQDMWQNTHQNGMHIE